MFIDFVQALFWQELAAYTFWGWTDIDVLYGDVLGALHDNNHDILTDDYGYDVLGTGGTFENPKYPILTGPMTFIRNTQVARSFPLGNDRLIMHLKDLLSRQHAGLDEHYSKWLHVNHSGLNATHKPVSAQCKNMTYNSTGSRIDEKGRPRALWHFGGQPINVSTTPPLLFKM